MKRKSTKGRRPAARRKRRTGPPRMADLEESKAPGGTRLPPLEQRGAESRNPSPDQGRETRRDDIGMIEEKGPRHDDFGRN